jgi:hypothetical protein
MSKTVHILTEGGTIIQMDLPLHEAIADRLAKGHLKLVTADGAPVVEKSARTQPAPYAPKGDWVGWAVHVSQSTDSPIEPDDAEALTKQDLIERYGVS